MKSVFVLLGELMLGLNPAIACVVPTGLGNGTDDVYNPNTLALPDDGIWISFIVIARQFIFGYETPIQFRLFQLSDLVIFSSMSAYEETSLDNFGRQVKSEQRRRCRDNIDDDAFELYRRVTLAYTMYYCLSAFFPQGEGMTTHI